MKKIFFILSSCLLLSACSKNPDVIALKCTGKVNSITGTGNQISESSEIKITSFVATRTNKSIFEVFQEPQYIVRFENLNFDKKRCIC
uniref:lipoprotein n=1 Tax=Polynucleobacter sp. TaxID=2029855 RepID=UPI0040471AB6